MDFKPFRLGIQPGVQRIVGHETGRAVFSAKPAERRQIFEYLRTSRRKEHRRKEE